MLLFVSKSVFGRGLKLAKMRITSEEKVARLYRSTRREENISPAVALDGVLSNDDARTKVGPRTIPGWYDNTVNIHTVRALSDDNARTKVGPRTPHHPGMMRYYGIHIYGTQHKGRARGRDKAIITTLKKLPTGKKTGTQNETASGEGFRFHSA